MKRSSGPRKTANLSESTNRQLNKYALAAGAAGVGMLALARPAEAKIVYTPASIHINNNSGARLDFNHDGINDFEITSMTETFTTNGRRHRFPEGTRGAFLSVHPLQSPNRVVAARNHCAAALPNGVKVGRHSPFEPGSSYVQMAWSQGGQSGCPWRPVKQAYLGVKFVVNGKVHFGWARIKRVSGRGFPAIITGYAYETIPNYPIITGKTTGTDDVEKYDPGSGAFLTNPILDTPQPASLGMLALGAQGVPLWRRKETQELIGQ